MSLNPASFFFLIPILAVSVYAVALILQKALQTAIHKPLSDVHFERLLEQCQLGYAYVTEGLAPRHPVALVLEVSPAQRKRCAQTELSRYEDRIAYLPILANVATLLGLFGTVTGMILAFLALRAGGGADPAALAGGIAQSLIATALGLMAAVPCLGFHAVFQRRADRMASQLETLLDVLEEPRRE